MFGAKYKFDMALEIFLRYLDKGITKIATVKKALSFIPDKQFAYILKTAVERNLIKINLQNKTVFMSRKTKTVIDFIEKYNFIEEYQKWEYDDTYKFSSELTSELKLMHFFEKNYHDVNADLAGSMKMDYGEDYSTEIMNFGFYVCGDKRNEDETTEEDESKRTETKLEKVSDKLEKEDAESERRQAESNIYWEEEEFE